MRLIAAKNLGLLQYLIHTLQYIDSCGVYFEMNNMNLLTQEIWITNHVQMKIVM